MDDQRGNRFDPGTAFMRMWSQSVSAMMAAAAPFPPHATLPQAARHAQSTTLDAWGKYCEQFMRSPEFLQLIKQSLAGSLQFRKQLNDLLGRMHHEFQGTSRQDVDQLMLSMRHLEQRMVDGLERLATQMDQFNARHHEDHHEEGG